MFTQLQQHGLKMALPLLLLTTACGQGNTGSYLVTNAPVKDAALAKSGEIVQVTKTSDGYQASTPDKSITFTEKEAEKLVEDLKQQGYTWEKTDGPTKVPEPATILGIVLVSAGAYRLRRPKTTLQS